MGDRRTSNNNPHHTEKNMSNTTDSAPRPESAFANAMMRTIERANAAAERTRSGACPLVPGLPSGFIDVDNLVGGYRPGQLIVLAGRPGMGVTAKALADTLNIVARPSDPRAVAFVSLRMSIDDVVERLVSMEARVDTYGMRHGNLLDGDIDRMLCAMQKMRNVPLFIEARSHAHINNIIGAVDEIAHVEVAPFGAPLGLVVVDGLRFALSNADHGYGDEPQFSAHLRVLKRMALALKVPVLVTAEVGGAVDAPQRYNRRPLPRDLIHSDAIMGQADLVQMLYRDEVYDECSPDKGIAEVITAKNSTGRVGVSKIAWMQRFTLFTNIAQPRDA